MKNENIQKKFILLIIESKFPTEGSDELTKFKPADGLEDTKYYIDRYNDDPPFEVNEVILLRKKKYVEKRDINKGDIEDEIVKDEKVKTDFIEKARKYFKEENSDCILIIAPHWQSKSLEQNINYVKKINKNQEGTNVFVSYYGTQLRNYKQFDLALINEILGISGRSISKPLSDIRMYYKTQKEVLRDYFNVVVDREKIDKVISNDDELKGIVKEFVCKVDELEDLYKIIVKYLDSSNTINNND